MTIRFRSREEFLAYREQSVARMSRAAGALYESRMVKPWVPELGPLTKWERSVVRELVAERVTYETDMKVRFG